MRVSAVCLDAAGTLFTERRTRAALYADALEVHGHPASESQVQAWMERAHAELDADPRSPTRYGEAWFRAFVGGVLGRAGCPSDPEQVRQELERVFTDPSNYLVFEDVLPTLHSLRSAGLKLAVVSNWSQRLEGLLIQLGLRPWFDALAISACVGADKPEPELFQHALRALDVEPEQAVHVGDRWDLDVLGARSAGLTGLLIDRPGQHEHGPCVLRLLTELPERLQT